MEEDSYHGVLKMGLNFYRMQSFLRTLFLLLLFSASIKAQRIADLIRPIHLTAGITDSLMVSDIFYAKDYKVQFKQNKNIKVSYLSKSNTLCLTSGKNFEGMDLIDFTFNGNNYELPVTSEIPQAYSFTYKPEGNPKSVNLFGSFNGWNRQSLPMKFENGVYRIKINLEPGSYQYRFYVDGSEIVDPTNPDKVPNGMGGLNSAFSILPRHTQRIYLDILGKSITDTSVSLFFHVEKGKNPFPVSISNIIALINNTKIPEQQIKITGSKIELKIKGEALHQNVIIRLAVNKNGQTSNLQTVHLFKGVPAGHEKNLTLQDQIIYSIMIDRFYDGDKSNDKPVVLPDLSFKANYQGGDLQGILDKINSGYFDSLGVNTLWISPVVDNPDSAYREYPAPHRLYTGYHGYWPLHSSKVEEHFGNMSLLKKLISTAHQHKIKVLIDYVAHHVFIKNPLYKKHRDWFGVLYLPNGKRNLRLWDEERLTTWFDTYLPTFNYVGSKAARNFMTNNAVWWLKQTDADGFRHDAVKHIPNEFWRLLTRKIKKEIEIPEKRKIYQIGETFGSYKLVDSYVNNGQLNAQFNFNLYDVAIPTFLDPKASFKKLDNEIQKSFLVYGENNLMGNIMDSHDKVRFMAFADGEIPLDGNNASEIGWTDPPTVKHESSYEKLKLYLSYLLTIPGIPVIDYGDEIGMTGAADPDNRRMMRFGNLLSPWERETLHDVRKIINIRDNNSALRYGDFQTLAADTNNYVYLRSDMNERILIALNKSSKPKTLNISFPEIYHLDSGIDLYSGNKYKIVDNTISITIPAIGFRIIKVE